jgi:hypothetical protein
MSVKTKTPPVQEKYGVLGNLNSDGSQIQYGPFDTVEAADKTLASLTATGVLRSDAQRTVIMTCQTARTHVARANSAKATTAEPVKAEVAPATPAKGGKSRKR